MMDASNANDLVTPASEDTRLATYAALRDLTTCRPFQTFQSGVDWRTYLDGSNEAESWKAFNEDVLQPLSNRVELFATAVNAGVFDFDFVRRATRAMLISIWENDAFQYLVSHQRAGATIMCEFEALVERLKGPSDA